MRTRVATVATAALAVMLVAGCAPVRIAVSDPSGLDELNRRVRGKTVQVALSNGKTTYVRNAHVDADSLTWADTWTGEMATGHWTGERGALPAGHVRAIKIQNPWRGILRGLARGAGVGLALAVPVYLRSDEPYSEAYFVAFPALCALVGAPLGAFSYSEEYEFAWPAKTKRASTRTTANRTRKDVK